MATTYLAVVKAEYDYAATTDEELSVTEDQQLYVIEYTDDDWWKVRVKQSPSDGLSPSDAPTGLIPASYVTALQPLRQVLALYDYEATSDEEISIKENETYDLYEDDGDWTLVGAKDKQEVGFAPTAYLEEQAGGATNGHDGEEEAAPASIPAPPPPPPAPPLPAAAGAAASSRNGADTNGGGAPTSDKVLTWANVTSLDGKKKKKGTLGIGNGSIFFASDSDKAPVQKKDLGQLAGDISTEKNKNIKMSFTDRQHLHFTVSKDDFDAIVRKIGSSRAFAQAGGSAAAAAQESDAEEEDTYIPPPPPPPPGSAGAAKAFGFLPPPPRRMVGSDSENSDDDDDDDSEPPRNRNGGGAAPAAIPAPPPPPPMPAAFSPPPAAPRAPAAPALPAAVPAAAAAPSVGASGGGKRARAEYDFAASESEELSITEGETLYVLDDSADDWWKVRNERGEEGEVPASYVELLEDDNADGETDGDADAARRLDDEQRAEAKKERERLRLKKLEEEARGMAGFANFQPPPARKTAPAAAPAPRASSPPATVSPPPPPAPPAPPMAPPPPQQQQQPPSRRAETRDSYDAVREQRRERHRQRERERESQQGGGGGSGSGGDGRRGTSAPVEKSKPSPARVRTWADKTGAFKVDAEFVGFSGARGEKIRLHKLNGVVIEVPLEKMSQDDVRLVEHLARKRNGASAGSGDGERRSHRSDRDRGDRDRHRERENSSASRDDGAHRARPPSATAPGKRVSMAASQTKKSETDWFEWFLNAGCDIDDCERYARNFDKDRIDESIIGDLEPATLRSLGLREGDLIRVRKHIAKKGGGGGSSNGLSSSSSGQGPPPPDKDPRKEAEEQMMTDEELARKLQEEMNAGRDGSGLFTNASGGVKNTRRGRPQPKSAPSTASFDSIASSLTERSVTPSNDRVRSPDIAKEASRRPSSTAPSSSGFDDDAWTVKPAAPAKSSSPALLIDDGSRSSTPATSSSKDLASLRQAAASPANMPTSSKEASSAQALTDAYLDSIGLGKRTVTESGSGLPARQAAASPQPPAQQQQQQQQAYAQQQQQQVSPQQTGYYPSQSPANGPRQPPAPIPLNQQLLNPLIPTQTGMTGFIPTRNTQSPMGMMPQQTGFVPQQTGFVPQQTGYQQPQQTGYQQPQQTGFPGQSPFGNQFAVMHQPSMPSYGGMMQPQPTGYPLQQMSQMSMQPTGAPYQAQPQQQMQIPQAPPPPPMPTQQQPQPTSSQGSDFQPSSIFAQMKAGQFAKPDGAPQEQQKYDALRPQPTGFNPGMSQGPTGFGQPQQTGFGGPGMPMQPLQAQPTGFAPGGYMQPQQQQMMFPQQTGYQYRPY